MNFLHYYAKLGALTDVRQICVCSRTRAIVYFCKQSSRRSTAIVAIVTFAQTCSRYRANEASICIWDGETLDGSYRSLFRTFRDFNRGALTRTAFFSISVLFLIGFFFLLVQRYSPEIKLAGVADSRVALSWHRSNPTHTHKLINPVVFMCRYVGWERYTLKGQRSHLRRGI